MLHSCLTNNKKRPLVAHDKNHQYVTKTAYVVLGINMDSNKDILGVWIGEHESSKFWLSVLNDLKSRGVLDVYLFCVDGLKGFRESISAVYPKAHIQRCIIHQIRSSTRYVDYKDIKTLMPDLKLVYKAVTEEEAYEHLAEFKDKWGKQYPSCVRSREENWDILSTFFAYLDHWTARCRNWDMVLNQLELMFVDRIRAD